MADDDANLIRITHFINPTMFWFKYEASFLDNVKLLELENELQQYYLKMHQKHGKQKYEPRIEEMVGVYHVPWSRWIRATVDHVLEYAASAPKYVTWAVDYGIPLQTEVRWIRKLPETFAKVQSGSICFGGLNNIVPAEKTYDFMKNCATLQISDKWSPLAIKMINDLITDAASIKFVSHIKNKEQLFGNLEITTHTNQCIKADIVLLDTNQATTSSNFFNILPELQINNVPRWQTNDGNTQIFKYYNNVINSDNIKYQAAAITTKPNNIEESVNSDCDKDIVKKVTDWGIRNDESKFKDEITINDISFNDSASILADVNASVEKAGNNQEISSKVVEEETLRQKAGSCRKARIENFNKKFIPRQPIDEVQLPLGGADGGGAEAKASKHSESTLSRAKEDSSQILKTPENNKVSNETNVTNGTASPGNSNDSDGKSDNKSTLSNNSKTCTNSRVAELLKKRAKLEANKLKPLNVIPAGYDMRNLQNTKDNQQHSKREDNKSQYKREEYKQQFSTSSKERYSMDRKEVDDSLLNSTMSKMNISIKNDKNKNKKRLEELDEVCVESNLTTHLVLVHGKNISRPIEKLANANFCEDVHRELENMRFNHIYRIQSYAWVHLMRGNSLIIVNSARTGKTMSYLPALCSLIKGKYDDKLVPDGVGPIGIIVAPSSIEVEKISRICKRFFYSRSRKVSVVDCYGIRNKKNAMSYLLNGCEVLVATPSALARLLSHEEKLFEMKRIQHLVIDNIDLMHDEVRKDLQMILKKCCPIDKETKKSDKQIVVTTRSWHPLINGFLKLSNSPQLCIGAYIEAAVYAHSKFQIKLIEKKSKTQEVLDFIKKHPYAAERTVVVCNTDEDVETVSETLKVASIYSLSVTSYSKAEEIELVSEWHHLLAGDMKVLICTDSVLPELKIQTAQNLIHYSLPSSWSKFAFRFSSYFRYYDDLLQLEDNIPKKPRAISLILLDEHNNSQLPKLIEFLQKHGCENIPKAVLQLSNVIKTQREKERILNCIDFCPNIMEFGYCWNKYECNYRHGLTSFDAAGDNIPTEGIIKVKILTVLSPTHYCVRLLEHKSYEKHSDWQEIKNSNNYVKFNLEFSEYFSNIDNHQSHRPVQLNDICVAIDMNTYHRCKIIYISSSPATKATADINLRIKLVDLGRIISCKSSNLLVLPEQFRNYPFQAVDLRLANIIPYDFETVWDSKSTETVRQWIQKYATSDVHVQASINFSLMDTIWADNIILLEQLKSISSHVYHINIKKSLLEKQFAVSNDTIEFIKQSARQSDILDEKEKNLLSTENNCPNTESSNITLEISSSSCDSKSEDYFNSKQDNSKTEYKELKNQSQSSSISKKDLHINRTEELETLEEKWEILSEDEYLRVFIGSFYSPNNFYVQNVRNLPSLEGLYNEIDNFISINKIPITEPIFGLNCLAKYEGKYNRGKITKIICDDRIKTTVFFCDIGISKTFSLENVLHSNSSIVNFLPFQAIRCKLIGINSSISGYWTEEICDQIYENIIDTCEFLYVRPIKSYKPTIESVLKYWRYDVILIDCTTEKDVKLNEKIVEKGLAEYDEETKHFLDLVINLPNVSNEYELRSETGDDEESWDHINYKRPINTNLNSEPKKDGLINFSDINFLDLDINFTEEETLQLLNLPSSAKILPPIQEDKTIQEKTDSQNEKNKINYSTNSSIEDVSTSNNKTIHKKKQNSIQNTIEHNNIEKKTEEDHDPNTPKMPRIKVIYKCPDVIWQQSESLICLHVTAPDIVDYTLKVTTTHLIFTAQINNNLNVLLVNFFGGINPELTSHEIRGLNVIIRLEKSLKGFNWPRLTWESDKLNWLKYNYEAIDVKDSTIANTGRQIFWDNFSMHDSSSSDISDVAYEELNADDIENADKMYDPLADDF